MPSEVTQVKLLYDDDALYVGARLQRGDPSAIRTSIMRRDDDSDAEVFIVSLTRHLPRPAHGIQLLALVRRRARRLLSFAGQ